MSMGTAILRKHCPYCRQDCAASAKVCSNCGYAFPKARRAAQIADSRKICPKCGFRARKQARICSQCGHEFVIQLDPQPHDKMQSDEKACPVCGTVSHLSAKVCRQCGTRFAVESYAARLVEPPASILPAEAVTASNPEPALQPALQPTHGEPAPDMDEQTLEFLRDGDEQIEIDLFGRPILRFKRN